MLTIALAVLSLVIVFWIDDVGGQYQNAKQKDDRLLLRQAEQKFGWIERLVRCRLVLAIALWLLVGVQVVLYFNSRGCWFTLPLNVDRWAEWAYGTKLPEAHCIPKRHDHFV